MKLRGNDPCFCGSGRKFKHCHRPAYDPVRPGRVSPLREVPAGIPRPRWHDGSDPGPETEDPVKPPEVIEAMRRAGRIAAEVLAEVGEAIAPGVTTDELDAICHEACIRRGAYPSPLRYKGFPKSVCTSVNEVICHGIPDDRPLRDGDIISVDVTVFIDGVHGDNCATWPVGTVDERSAELIRVTREAMERGIEAAVPGAPVNVIGRAIEEHARAHGFDVVRDFIGHGIGREFHSAPTILHYFHPRATTRIEPGMTFTVEPMIAAGRGTCRIWADGWTAVTADRSRCAQFENTILVGDDGPEVLTPTPASAIAAT